MCKLFDALFSYTLGHWYIFCGKTYIQVFSLFLNCFFFNLLSFKTLFYILLKPVFRFTNNKHFLAFVKSFYLGYFLIIFLTIWKTMLRERIKGREREREENRGRGVRVGKEEIFSLPNHFQMSQMVKAVQAWTNM